MHSNAGSSQLAPQASCTPCHVTKRSRWPPTCRWGLQSAACNGHSGSSSALSLHKCTQLVLHLEQCKSGTCKHQALASLSEVAGLVARLQRCVPCSSVTAEQKAETSRSNPGCGINLISVYGLQKEAGISSAHYHAGMSAGARVKVQNAWRSGAVQVGDLLPWERFLGTAAPLQRLDSHGGGPAYAVLCYGRCNPHQR